MAVAGTRDTREGAAASDAGAAAATRGGPAAEAGAAGHAPTSRTARRSERAALGLLVAGAAVLHAWNLGHAFLAPWDEAVHAVVAEHLERHPLHPTLYETALLPPQGSPQWTWVQTWLHIPPFGMLASALSMRLLGDTPLALRLPGLLFVVLGMLATYALGRRLFGVIPGLVGAAFVGYAPYALLVSQGYVFGDATDTPLLALTPAAMLALVIGCQTGRRRWLVAAGLGFGLCYLTKSALGILPCAVAVVLCVAGYTFLRGTGWHLPRWKDLAAFVAALGAVVVPYTLYIGRAFPATAQREADQWRQAFFGDYEGWGRPPDYHLTRYLYALYGEALALAVVAAVVVVCVLAMRRRSPGDLALGAWVLAIYAPLSVAMTKSAPMTLAASPALGLALGRVATLGLRSPSRPRRAAAMGLLAGTALMALLILAGAIPSLAPDYATVVPPSMRPGPGDQSDIGIALGLFWGRAAPYALELLLAAVCAGVYWLAATAGRRGGEAEVDASERGGLRRRRALRAGFSPRFRGCEQRWRRGAVPAVVAACVAMVGVYWLGYDAQAVGPRTPAVVDVGVMPAVGRFVDARSPANATVLVVGGGALARGEALDPRNGHVQLMFWAHRDVYMLDGGDAAAVCPLAARGARAGSPVVLLAAPGQDVPAAGAVLARSGDGWTLYAPACG